MGKKIRLFDSNNLRMFDAPGTVFDEAVITANGTELHLISIPQASEFVTRSTKLPRTAPEMRNDFMSCERRAWA